MHPPLHNEKRPLTIGDRGRFLKSLIDSPRLTGAVAPSGRALARAMAAASGPPPRGVIVELGPGTGPVTKALIQHGVEARRLVLVEFNPGFCRLLRSRFPLTRVIEGDAYDLPHTLSAFGDEQISAVVSSLPLLNQPPHRREKVLDDAFALMGPGGVFVQFTYGPASPVPTTSLAGRYTALRSAPVWLNLPPARVWTYRVAAGESRAHA
jgi:phosphatidylethanolamine/phosphatidyl-N-methylethanolamine N-methyltransferase